ncbi:MAG: FecR family protein, partial [Cyclobacteriaceae bacterium]
MDQNPLIWHLWAKKLSGELSLEEEKLLKRFEANPEHRILFDQLKIIWTEARPPQPFPEIDKELAWHRLEDQLDREEDTKELAPSSIPRLNPVFAAISNVRWLAAAGVVCLLVVIAFHFSYYFKPQQQIAKKEILNPIPKPTLKPQELPAIQISSDSLELLILPDKSRVWLNKNSRLSYDTSFNRSERQVALVGEAFFEVRPDTARPFVIWANESKTSVLGTSFNLRAYDNEDPTVTVVTGKVGFANANISHTKVVLTPGEKGSYNRTTDKISKKRNDNYHFLDWKHALVYKREIATPSYYIRGTFTKKKSVINQTEIEGKLHN